MQLYYLPGACSIGIRALLAEIGKPYATREAARPGTDGYERFLGINPKGKVPALIRDDGSLLTEFPVIALYLARLNPERELIPTDLEGEIRVLEMTEYLASTVHMQGFARVRRPERFAPSKADHPAVKAAGLQIFQAGLDRAEAQLDEKVWLFGKMSIADFALFYIEFWSAQHQIGTLGTQCRAHHDRVLSRPAIAKAVESDLKGGSSG